MDVKKSISEALLKGFRAMCGPNDQKRLSKQVYPTLKEYTDLPYLEDGNPMHLLDIYVPEGTKDTDHLPVIIDIHGGGWSYGDKELNKNYCLHLAERGFAVVNISYRLCPEYTIVDQMQDCNAALLWVKNNLGKYPMDPNRIYLTGDSAGGQLAAHLAAANLSDEICAAYKMERVGLNVKAIALTSGVPYLNVGGIYDVYTAGIHPEGYAYAMYNNYGNLDACLDAVKEYPPVILFTSLLDVVANWQTVRATKDLQARGIACKLDFQLNPKLGHVYPVAYSDSKYGKRAGDQTAAWFNKYR